MAVEPATGRVLVAGTTVTRKGCRSTLARLGPDGKPDVTFGAKGFASTATAAALSGEVLVLPDGRIVVAGAAEDGAHRGVGLVRYRPDGKLDRSFGSHGRAFLDFPDRPRVSGVVRQRDGGFVFAARYPRHVGLIRVKPDGKLDRAFGVRGRVKTPFRATGIHDLVLQPDGKLLAVGGANVVRPDDTRQSVVVLLRYTSDGRPDRSFGTGGYVVRDVNGRPGQMGYAAAVQPNGSVVVAGQYGGSRKVAALMRFTRAGELDTAFGQRGVVSYAPPAGRDGLFPDVVVGGDALLVVAAVSGPDGRALVGLLRYDGRTGAPDQLFAPGGAVAGAARQAAAARLAVAPGGRVLLAGANGPAGRKARTAVRRYGP